MPPILLAHAEGEVSLADLIAGPLRDAGYDVVYEGTALVGESLVQEASKALGANSPVVLCGTVAALGTGWAHQLVNAARAYPGTRIFALQMEKLAYLQPLALDGRIAAYWQDPNKAIDDLIKALREYYPPTPATGHSSADSLDLRYRDLALRTYDIVDLANLPVTDRNLATRELLLRSLYVALRVAPEPEHTSGDSNDAPRGSVARRDIDLAGDVFDAGKRWSVGELLTRNPRLVVLGDPGAGKSTLLRWMATAYLLRLNASQEWRELPDVANLPDEDWLPILIRCRDLEDPQAAASLEQILDHHLRKLGISGAETKQLNELLFARLSAGSALLLFDGLDEIAHTATRARFCRQVEQIHVAYPELPIVATSRIVGYREMGLRISRGFEHATVLDLTAQDKDEFAHRWCAVTESVARGESAEKELIADIHSTDRIERLTGNPMLLTTMALVKKKVGKLPSRRADLYREAVDVLLNWRSDVDERLDPYEAMPQLEYIAYAMCAAGVQQLRADEITGLLGKMRTEFPSVRAVRRHDPSQFLQLLERRTGILVEIGRVRHRGRLVPAYEFRHLTFQEYLASLSLVEGRFPTRDRQRSLAQNVSPLAAQVEEVRRNEDEKNDLIVNRNWSEALRLCVTSCNDDDVDSVLLAIADVREDEAPITAHPRAALAMSCLSDEPNVSEDIAINLIDRFIGIIQESDTSVSQITATRTLAEVNNSLWGPILIRRLIIAWLAAPDEDSPLGAYVSDISSQHIPGDDDEIRPWLAQEVCRLSDTDIIERIHACLLIMQAAYENILKERRRQAKVLMVSGMGPKLIAMLKHPGREAEAAAWAIGWLAHSHSFAKAGKVWNLSSRQKAILVSCIKDPRTSVSTCKFLLWALEADYSNDTDFAETVLVRLSGAGPASRSAIKEDYERLFPTCVDPVISLMRRATGPVAATAVDLLGDLGADVAVEPLVAALADPDARTRDSAAAALGRLGDGRAVGPLVAALNDPDAKVRDSAAAALGEIGDGNAVEPLLAMLALADAEVRESVATALGRLGDRRALQPLLEAKRLYGLLAPSAVAAALAILGNDSEVREFQQLMQASSQQIRMTSLWALARLEPDSFDRILLSRHADGMAPGIDPRRKIRLMDAQRCAANTNQRLEDACKRYQLLKGRYLLKLQW